MISGEAFNFRQGTLEGRWSLDTLNSLTKYPSIETYHAIGGKGILREFVDLATRDFNKYGYDCVFRFSDKASGREVARGKFGMVFYDRMAKKAAPMPEAFKARIGG